MWASAADRAIIAAPAQRRLNDKGLRPEMATWAAETAERVAQFYGL